MWVTGHKKDEKSKKGKKLPKMADFCQFFLPTGESGGIKLSLRDICPHVPSLLYYHLSHKKYTPCNLCTDLGGGATQNPEFPQTKPKAICGWGTFSSIFGSGQVRNLLWGRGIFYQGMRYFFPRILGIPKFIP